MPTPHVHLQACLSGIGAYGRYPQGSFVYAWYRVVFDSPFPVPQPLPQPNPIATPGSLYLRFGAVDWNSTFWLNGRMLGGHVGGYDGFSFDATPYMKATGNELIVFAHDPSDEGYQPHGKQRISAINQPGGDTYVPSSGIWQTVWMESVPAVHVSALKLYGDATTGTLQLTVQVTPPVPASVQVTVSYKGQQVTTFKGVAGVLQSIPIPQPWYLWNIGQPNLYDLKITATEVSTSLNDTVGSYFGMRTVSLLPYVTPAQPATGPQVGLDRPGNDLPGSPFTLPQADYNLCWAACNQTAACKAWAYGVPNCNDDPAQPQCWLKASTEAPGTSKCRVSGSQGSSGGPGMRPAINGQFTFLAGWLDQSWWPDGEYTAPSDAALAFDLQALATFGLNSVRLHQKVNSERWYYWADTLGITVQQDGVQKYGGASAATIQPFLADWKAMVDGRGNHPSIFMWTVFNEGDCVGVFPDVPAVVSWAQAYDPTRLVDTNSGGSANGLYIGSVNDIHSYPYPGSPRPSATQFAEIGEFGGIGAFITGKEWVPGQCNTYLHVDTPQLEAATYINMTLSITAESAFVSQSVYTQITDVERECDGFLNMDRTNKFTPADTQAIAAANQAMIAAAQKSSAA